jgi:Trp operon repressor
MINTKSIDYFEIVSTEDRMIDFCQIIKFFFETNEILYQNFMKMIMFMRTRMITDLETDNWDSYNKRLTIVNEVLMCNLSVEEIQEKFANFKMI